jgi:hypothetical protein
MCNALPSAPTILPIKLDPSATAQRPSVKLSTCVHMLNMDANEAATLVSSVGAALGI